jgi:hypothetical protein
VNLVIDGVGFFGVWRLFDTVTHSSMLKCPLPLLWVSIFLKSNEFLKLAYGIQLGHI